MPPASRKAEASRPVVLPAGIWTFSRGSQPTRELTILSKRLGISVSVLQFDDDAGDAVLEEEAPWDSYDQLTAWEQR